MNHPFVDGNKKRIGHAAMEAFLLNVVSCVLGGDGTSTR
jgi:prophage maintenance system killer protein